MSPAGIVEERCLAAVGVAHECHVDFLVLALGYAEQPVLAIVLQRQGLRLHRERSVALCLVSATGVPKTFVLSPQLSLAQHLNQRSLVVAQAHFVAHKSVFHRVLQGRIE